MERPSAARRNERPAMTAGTVFALATPAGRSGIAVFRISGPQAGAALRALTGRDLPAPRCAARRRFRKPDRPVDPSPKPSTGPSDVIDDGAIDDGAIDDGLALWFPAPASFTGEDVAELHVHGGPAVIAALAEALRALGLAPAEPGAFTRRAFDHGKLDLTEVEGLADLIAAETEAQRRQALRQLEGALGRRIESWRAALIGALAHIEASIDFSDEDLPAGLVESVDEAMAVVAGEIARALDDRHRGERLREGLSVVILGAPNAGKSSLLNRLAKREAAIVSAEAGTTRDVIELHLDLGGYPLVLADTAGLRETESAVESEGVRRALQRAAGADLKIVVLDATAWPDLPEASRAQIDAATILVLNKADLRTGPLPGVPSAAIPISAKTGAGVDDLVAELGRRAGTLMASGDQPAMTRARHRAALDDCARFLGQGLRAEAVELKSEELRLAVRALGRITGRVDVEEVLDRIFGEFCIGK
ncbi:MAG TPA: tRNA uridine-5-carboxymethylaminomethyl(34) synthesis GTPase MnmE [Dongiaceae bacterium]|nr:tRNA uridine-5-carboxymethylaminomethyl(34) synthesis GTPase MnmE [Dongiaceae bacterium]